MNLWTSGVAMLLTPRQPTSDEQRDEKAAENRAAGRDKGIRRAKTTAKQNNSDVLAQFKREGIELHAPVIAARTGKAMETVRQALYRLESMGLLERRKDGRAIYFRKAA